MFKLFECHQQIGIPICSFKFLREYPSLVKAKAEKQNLVWHRINSDCYQSNFLVANKKGAIAYYYIKKITYNCEKTVA